MNECFEYNMFFYIQDDVSGSCWTLYRPTKYKFTEKVKYLDSCKDHKISHTNIDGIPMSNVISGEQVTIYLYYC